MKLRFEMINSGTDELVGILWYHPDVDNYSVKVIDGPLIEDIDSKEKAARIVADVLEEVAKEDEETERDSDDDTATTGRVQRRTSNKRGSRR